MVQIMHFGQDGYLDRVSFPDLLDTNDRLIEYLRATEIWPGDTLQIIGGDAVEPL